MHKTSAAALLPFLFLLTAAAPPELARLKSELAKITGK